MATRTPPTRKAQSPATTTYLVAYNTLSFFLWSYILLQTINFIVSGPHIIPPVSSQSATGTLNATEQARQFLGGLATRFFGFPPVHPNPSKQFINAATGSSKLQLFPQFLSSLLSGSYAYNSLGPLVIWTQSLALLEVLHAATGLVKSSVAAVGMQVASRVWMVWGVVEMRSETHSHPLFTTMILAWSITESIRYAFYALSLVLPRPPKFLLWLRYNTFYILYPLGAGSEAFLMASVLPPLRTLPAALKSLIKHQQHTGILDVLRRTIAASSLGGAVRGWGAYEFFVTFLFMIWWPALYVLFTHMIVLRRKVFGKGKTLGGVPGTREKKKQ